MLRYFHILLFFILITGGMGQSHAQNKTIDSLLVLLKKDKEDTNKVNHLNKLCWEYQTADNYDTALHYGNFALQLAKQLNFHKGIANTYNNIGIIYSIQGNYTKALENCFASLKIREETGDKKSIAGSYNDIGLIYRNQGNYTKALENYLASLKIREETGDKKNIAASYNNIGLIYRNQSNYAMALENYFASLKIYKEFSNKAGIAASYINIGEIYRSQGNYAMALENYFASLKIYKEIGNKTGIASSYNNIGEIYRNQGNYTKALGNYFTSLKIYEEIDNKEGIATSYINIGSTYMEKKNYAEATTYLLNSLQLFKEVEVKDGMMEAYQRLSEVNEKMNDYKNAHTYYQLYSQIKDSIFNEESSKQITEMQTKYETEKKEKQIQLLNKENEVKGERLQKQQTVRNAIIGISGLLIIVVVLLYNRRQLKMKNSYQQKISAQQKSLSEELLKQEKLRLKSIVIAQEKERKRIAEELHDGIGQMLSAVKLNIAALDDSKEDDYKIQYKNAIELIDDSCSELRNISHNMMPGLLVKSGLIPALNDLADKLNHSYALKIFIESDGMEKRLDNAMEIQLYRIIQELLNNIIKYAHAAEIHIQLNRSESELTLMMEDDGKGFDTTILKTSAGNGWNNINSRLEILNAKIEIDSRVGKGTVMFIELPLTTNT
ncbi:MAG: sensor histidine kinase [Bacteroidetes bacterium]|nr:sensor histidine kinase [Bacteroidota bacterium]